MAIKHWEEAMRRGKTGAWEKEMDGLWVVK